MTGYDESKHVRNSKGEYTTKPGDAAAPRTGAPGMPYKDETLGSDTTIRLAPGVQEGEEDFFAPEPPEVGTNADNTPRLDYENAPETAYVWQDLRDADGNPVDGDEKAVAEARRQGMTGIRKTTYRDDMDRPRAAYLVYRDAPGDLPCPPRMQRQADGMLARMSDESLGSAEQEGVVEENDRLMESTPYCNAFSNALRRRHFPDGLPESADRVIQNDIQGELDTLYYSGQRYSETYAYSGAYESHARFLEAYRGAERDA